MCDTFGEAKRARALVIAYPYQGRLSRFRRYTFPVTFSQGVYPMCCAGRARQLTHWAIGYPHDGLIGFHSAPRLV